METTIQLSNETATVKLAGRFDFNAHRDFREALDRLLAQTEAKSFVLDLGEVSYLDSSALGMLLLLRDKAKQVGKPVRLANVKGSVRQVLDIANFSKMFDIV